MSTVTFDLLYPAHQDENQHYKQDHAQAATGIKSPTGAVRPGRKNRKQQNKKQYQK
jgi:hypothetical protein